MNNRSLSIISIGLLFSMINANIATASGELISDRDAMVAKCMGTGLFNAGYCECAYSVSLSLVDNRDIFDFFINSSGKNDSEIDSIYKGLVDGGAYSDKNFSSRKEKMEYLEGKFLLFSRRLHKKCG